MTKRRQHATDDLEQAIGTLVTQSSPIQPIKRLAPSPAVMELEINLDMIERRKTVRTIPVPEAIESNDEESWTSWDELMAQQDRDHAKESAVAKLRNLIRRKGREGR